MSQICETQVIYINPDDVPDNRAFTNVVVVNHPGKTVYIGGQNPVDASGRIVGKGDIKTQVAQVFENLQAALDVVGASLEHIIKWNVYVVQGYSLQAGFEVFLNAWGNRPNPPLITTLFVAGLAHPDFLVEMDAIAVIPTLQSKMVV
jgi:enamine deaminase RidA (YjgF/YER057c/UK114 family)